MAVSLTASQLADAGKMDTATATRLLPVVTALVEEAGPQAPVAVQDEAVIRCAGWLAESPSGILVSQADSVGIVAPRSPSAMRASGALSLLSPWVNHHAGRVESLDSLNDPGIVNLRAGETRLVHIDVSVQLPEDGFGSIGIAGTPTVAVTPAGVTVDQIATSGGIIQFRAATPTAGDFDAAITWQTTGNPVETIVSRVTLRVAP